MTLKGKLAALFPFLFAIIAIGIFAQAVRSGEIFSWLQLVLWVYVMPPLLCRFHTFLLPLPDGFQDLAKKEYVPWWGCHQLQLPFIAVPALEAPLHFVPGLFSAWLRLWGSKIGKNVYWTPRVEILDRNLIDVGDGVLFGHLSAMCCHMVIEVEGRPSLMIKRIRIGDKAFVSTLCQLGPGSIVAAGEKMKPMTKRYWRGDWQQ